MTSTAHSAPPLVEAAGISKSFPGVRALQQVGLRLDRGETLCVVGENGAGKSTLMKILGGVYTPDAGEILLDGSPVEIGTVEAAQRLGITLIHQELNLAESLDVAGNLFLGREPRWGGPLGLIRRSIYSDAVAVIERLGLDCSPQTPVSRLSIGQQQLVEIARAVSLKSRVLIMDEPTSSLTQRETDRLFEVIRDLKHDGVSILYISHRLAEVRAIADRVTVLRDGRNAGELTRDEISHDAIVRLMVGRDVKQFFHRAPCGAGVPPALASGLGVPPVVAQAGRLHHKPVFEARGLVVEPAQRRPIDFAIHGGEIVGMAGLMGAGRTELAEAIFGVRPLLGGTIAVDGKLVRTRSPADAIAAGVFLVPEDRRSQGLLLAMSVKENISLPSLDRLNHWGLVARRAERELADTMRQRLNIRTPHVEQRSGLLSGGNQQKIVIAKWLARACRLLILDEPTRGIDVGAKAEIYALMRELADQGLGVLMISSDLEEVLGVSDRVLVMHQGQLAGGLGRELMTEEAIMQLATGGESRE
ncbi:MAG TPA: sugar ABC transporter ATP-binding protein [Pirellulales bacterium]|nr:sugar ABC transporter ATP-binding protein [Pirellulales bacterium]